MPALAAVPSPALLRSIVDQIAPDMVEVRRDIHRHPELGWEERRTTERLATLLSSAGLDPVVRADGLGLHVDIGTGDRFAAFRADLDALPITEQNRVPYASSIDGVMHACGHDAHSAIAAGIAIALSRMPDLPGRVRIIFQPAEERIPGGAIVIRDEGVHLGAEAIIAFHVDPSLPAGRVGLRTGPITGASDRLIIELTGPGGHTSRPHLTTDLVYVAARIVTDLPVLVSHEVDPRQTVSVVFGTIEGGNAENVIPARVRVGGTIRLFDLSLWREMPSLAESLVHRIAEPLGATVKVAYHQGSPPVANDPGVIERLAAAAGGVLGAGSVVGTHQSLGSEDFAWFLEDIPGALIRLGAGISGRSTDLHSATFDIDEDAIGVGILVGAWSLLGVLAG